MAVLVAVAGLAVGLGVAVVDDGGGPAPSPPAALPGGYVAPEGTTLLGRVVRYRDRAAHPGPLTTEVAVLRIDGAPRDVWDRLLDQAAEVPAGPDSCTRYPVGEDDRGRPDRLECTAHGWVGNLTDRYRNVSIALSWIDPSAGGEPVAGIVVEEQHLGEGAGDLGALPDGPGPDRGGVASGPEVAAGAVAGEPLAPVLAPEGYVVEEGSEVIGDPGPGFCGTGGFHAVLRITGDVDEVVAAYTEQVEERFTRVPESDGDEVLAGERVVVRAFTAGGGGTVELVAVDPPDGEPLLLISRCND